MFTAVDMTLDEIRQGLVLRFTDGGHKFELIRNSTNFQLNSIEYWGASLEDPVDISYDEYNGIMVGTCKGLVDTVFADADASLPTIINKFYENERIFKEIFRI